MRSLFTLLFAISITTSLAQELLSNGNFTSQNQAWTVTGDFSYNTTYPQYNFDIGYGYSSDDPHDIGTLEQTFTIPINTTSAILSFYTNISSDEQPIQVYDFCNVGLETVGGGNTHQFIQLSNLDENNTYQNMDFSIPSSFYGSTVRLVFFFDNDGLTATRFRFDNVSVQATTSGGGGGTNDQDFYVYNENINVSSVNAGNSVDVSCRQAYQGTSINSTEDVYLGYYLSDDPSLSANDYMFPITNEYSNIGNSDAYDTESATLNIPSATASGQYYVIFKADYNNQFSETNELNNLAIVSLYINGSGPLPPTINLLSPVGYSCFSQSSNVTITAELTGSITSKTAEYSLDNGLTWNFIDQTNSNSSSYSVTWPIPIVYSSSYCLIRVSAFGPGGSDSDESNTPFSICPVLSPEVLDPNGISHLFNPFGTQYWLINNWVNGEVNNTIYPGSHHGENLHVCEEHYSQDFGRLGNFSPIYDINSTCNQDFNSPLYGEVIYRTPTLTNSTCAAGTNSGLGNQIIIRSLEDPNFAFRIAHLNAIFVQTGDLINIGQTIGQVGSTQTTSAHAHCSLFKNINQSYINNTGTLYDSLLIGRGFVQAVLPPSSCSILQNYSAEFDFDAEENGGGGSTTNLDEAQNIILDNDFVIPNPNNGEFELLISSNDPIQSVYTTNVLGESISFTLVNNKITLANPEVGVYLLYYMTNEKRKILRFIVD